MAARHPKPGRKHFASQSALDTGSNSRGASEDSFPRRDLASIGAVAVAHEEVVTGSIYYQSFVEVRATTSHLFQSLAMLWVHRLPALFCVPR